CITREPDVQRVRLRPCTRRSQEVAPTLRFRHGYVFLCYRYAWAAAAWPLAARAQQLAKDAINVACCSSIQNVFLRWGSSLSLGAPRGFCNGILLASKCRWPPVRLSALRSRPPRSTFVGTRER